MVTPTLSTQELSSLLNVTETTIKRWAEDGKIPCTKTLGGHRKFFIHDVLEFAEKNGIPVSGISPPPMTNQQMEQLQLGIFTQNYNKIAEVFLQESLQGDDRGLLELLLYLSKHRIRLATITDEVIRPALVHIGDKWKSGQLEVHQEHRASQAILEALVRFAPNVHSKKTNKLSAVCACLEGEHHEIGLHALKFVLESEGWHVHYLGANTPTDTLLSFMKAMKPELICLSFTVVNKKKQFAQDVMNISRYARSYGAKVMVGGFYSALYTPEDFGCHHIANSATDALSYIKEVFQLKPGPRKQKPSGQA
ncbi:MAG: cobalamin B12-binding domain-containing protein [Ignavibacteriae bacterium]|nr:cobalamin B12-binding domain-containing protein [Ignavibacteriota bacterium]